MKHILSLLLLLICCGCSNNMYNGTVVTAFKNTGELVSNIQKTSVPVLLPRSMFIVDNKLFIYREKEDKLFHIFNLPNLDYVCDVGNRGQGPDDFGHLDTRSFHVYKNRFNVLEATSNILKTVVFENDHLSVIHSEKMFQSKVSNNGFYLLADSVYLTFGSLIDTQEYCLFDKNTGKAVNIGDYPQWTLRNVDQPHEVFITYLKSCVVHPNGKKFAAFYGRFKRLRIYDDSVNLLHEVDVKIEPYSVDIEKDIREQTVYYIGQPHATSNYIYALCSNSNGNVSSATNDCELHIWDWEGNPVGCYKFDRKVSLMALSEAHNKIFALNNSVDNEIYIYDIPKLKNEDNEDQD